ncbi:MAG: aminopeptidase [Candidatus Wallbacteria bacterium]|mgnify:CR=1 FL=1
MKSNKPAKGNKKELTFKRENGYTDLSNDKKNKIFKFGEEYKKFLNTARTEREAIDEVVKMAEKAGYVSYDKVKYSNGKFATKKFYYVNRNKSMALVNIGKRHLTDGAMILLSHVDCPRIDLKGMPVYEEGGFCFFKTHYYGGIKKFQWISSPMSLHGVVTLKGGKTVKINVGDSIDEPAFMIPDLAIHVSGKIQGDRKTGEVIKGEEMNLIVGTIPSATDKDAKEKIKLNVLEMLFEKYGIKERDLISADLSVVPAMRSQDIGFDRSLIAGYGHDDRSCVYTTARATFDIKDPEYTTITYLFDREEIGSVGNASSGSLFINDIFEHILIFEGEEGLYHKIRKAERNSKALSADTTETYNPTWKGVFDHLNVPYINQGTTICKFTGAGGKRGANDASSEFMTKVIDILDEAGVKWQVGELGKVDEGGGGTVAKDLAAYNMDVIDIGPACMSLHCPTELISKFDLYSSYEAFVAFISYKGKF